MEDQEILEQVNKLFTKILKKPNVVLTYETTAADVDGWDSLTHMMLIDSVEKHFAIKLKLMEVMKLNNVGDLVAIVKLKTTK